MGGLGDGLSGVLGSDERSVATDWESRVDQLLYDGERLETSVDVGDGATVVVTSHRVLTFTPGAEGANFSQVDRPNVEAVGLGTRSNDALIQQAIQWGLVGVVLVIAGWVLDLGGILGDMDSIDTGAASEIGLGGVGGMLETVMTLLDRLDEFLLVVGLLALVGTAALVGYWYWDRERTLVVEVAGGPNLHVPRPERVDDVTERLERAIGLAGDP